MNNSRFINLLFLRASNDVRIQFLRYAFVGTVAFAVDFLALWALTDFLNVYYLVSAAVSFAAGLATNYLLSVRWVFRNRVLGSKGLEFTAFAVIGIVGLALNELIIWGLTEHLFFHYLISKIVSTAVVFLFNFFLRKYLLFR
jgi:putative flippase GtrA